jgi:hypothetical protein
MSLDRWFFPCHTLFEKVGNVGQGIDLGIDSADVVLIGFVAVMGPMILYLRICIPAGDRTSFIEPAMYYFISKINIVP